MITIYHPTHLKLLGKGGHVHPFPFLGEVFLFRLGTVGDFGDFVFLLREKTRMEIEWVAAGCGKKYVKTGLITLPWTNISHLGKGKIIFKSALVGDILLSRRVSLKAA